MAAERADFSASVDFGNLKAAVTASNAATSSSVPRKRDSIRRSASAPMMPARSATAAYFGEFAVRAATIRTRPAESAPTAAEALPPPGVGSPLASLREYASNARDVTVKSVSCACGSLPLHEERSWPGGELGPLRPPSRDSEA